MTRWQDQAYRYGGGGDRKGAKSGNWSIEDYTEINDNGVAPGVVIHDGRTYMRSIEDPTELMAALMQYLGVAKIENDEAELQGER